jgi:hypothetical protein
LSFDHPHTLKQQIHPTPTLIFGGGVGGGTAFEGTNLQKSVFLVLIFKFSSRNTQQLLPNKGHSVMCFFLLAGSSTSTDGHNIDAIHENFYPASIFDPFVYGSAVVCQQTENFRLGYCKIY